MYSIIPDKDNPVLRKTAHKVPLSDIDGKHIQNLIKSMKSLLSKEEHGVALAAPQVGERLRLFIISGRALARDSRNSPDDEVKPHRPAVPDQVYINPVMSKMSREKKEKHEGCLSIRGKWGTVKRSEKASVQAYDESGRVFTRGASGFLAHVFQHEIDHLDGILYIDKVIQIYDESEEKRS